MSQLSKAATSNLDSRKTIELDREFIEVVDDKKRDLDAISDFGHLFGGNIRWDDLLARRRVVLLAEAGSGKTTEMKARAAQQAERGHFSFYASVEDVARKGLEHSLKPLDRRRFVEWRSSDSEAWFFIDSVDEAKQSGVRLLSSLQALAAAISGAERRTHLIISGRYSDWQFRRDLADLNEELSIPTGDELPELPDPDQLVIDVIQNSRKKSPTKESERPIVYVMAPLDEPRVRRFAAGKDAKNLDTFIAHLEDGGLWQFARRPLDLDWLVQFWHSQKRLGSLAEMLDVCLRERLHEPNPDRSRQDSLDLERAYSAIERVGAAMIFARRDTVTVPDAEIDLSEHTSHIDLSDVLPEWSPQDRARLLTRAVFDPATLGRVRLHNDNEGAVRSYLAARWLRRLSAMELSSQDLLDLLFGEEHGLQVVRPCMREVAAWLSLWNLNVGRELAKREPFLLLDTGDPASLAPEAKERVLAAVVSSIAFGEDTPAFDLDNLKRFASSDLSPSLRRHWQKHASNPDIRKFLLRLIWLGKLVDCADLAAQVAFDRKSESGEALFAGRAIATTADAATKKRYGLFLTRNIRHFPQSVLWNAAEELFPEHFSIDQLLQLLEGLALPSKAARDGLGFELYGPALVARLTVREDLERLLLGLLGQIKGSVAADDRELSSQEKAYFPAIAAAATKLLELSQWDCAPTATLTAAVRLGTSGQSTRIARGHAPGLVTQLEKSAPRRRLAFWAFTEQLADHPVLRGRPISSLWDLQMLGWRVTLGMEDVDWLLADGPNRRLRNERQLVVNTALSIIRDAGWPTAPKERVRVMAAEDQVMNDAAMQWLHPSKTSTDAAADRKHKLLVERSAKERAKRDQSWIKFAANIRRNPSVMRNLKQTTEQTCDSRLFHLFQLLSQATDASHQSISSVAALEPMIGREAAEGFKVGLIAHWRAWTPWLRSRRKPSEQNEIRWFDSMGLAGVALEQAGNPNWVDSLSDNDVRRATEYATLELNGFPSWLDELAAAKSHIVKEVLSTEVHAELAAANDVPWSGKMQDLASRSASLAHLVAPTVFKYVTAHSELPTNVLSKALDIIVQGGNVNADDLKTLLQERFRTELEPERSSLFIRALYSCDAELATSTLFERLDAIRRVDRPAFVQRLLPSIFGRMFDDKPAVAGLSLPDLLRLIVLAFTSIRIEDDNRHESGQVFSPDLRDDAETARGNLLSRLLNTPGRAAFHAIGKLARIPGNPISAERIRHFQKVRAQRDADLSVWPPLEVVEFERTTQTQPRTTRELQALALRRIRDLQYELVHDDFQQGRTLAGLPTEREVQKFVADRLRLKQGRSYSLEREVHVADEKEPDVRLRSRIADVSVPLEIKIVESWTLEQLDDALRAQLCGKYLRPYSARHGILLLVHQRPRPKGWIDRRGRRLTFVQVVARLRVAADQIAASAPEAPQPQIGTLDMTTFAQRKKRAKQPAKGGSSTRARTRKAKVATSSAADRKRQGSSK